MDLGIPHEEHLEIDDQIVAAVQALERDRESGDTDAEAKYMFEVCEASEALNELYKKYRN